MEHYKRMHIDLAKEHILKESIVIDGHEWIYKDFIERLANADIAASSRHLGLALNPQVLWSNP